MAIKSSNQITFTDMTDVYSDMIISFQIYSTDGIEFGEEIDSITLKIAAFKGNQRIEDGASYAWYLWDEASNDYVPIEGANSTSFVATSDTYINANIRATMIYEGNTYEDYITLINEPTVYSATVQFFNGSNVFQDNDKFLVAYPALYRNGIEVDALPTNRYYAGDDIVLNTKENVVSQTEIVPQTTLVFSYFGDESTPQKSIVRDGSIPTLQLNQSYRVNWDGMDYDVIATSHPSGALMIGYDYLHNIGDNTCPFGFLIYSESNVAIYSDVDVKTSHTFAIAVTSTTRTVESITVDSLTDEEDGAYCYFIYPTENTRSYEIGLYQYNSADDIWMSILPEYKYNYSYDGAVNENEQRNRLLVVSRNDISKNLRILFSVSHSSLSMSVKAEATIFDINDPVVGANAPINPKNGQLWLNTLTTPNTLKMWDESRGEWVDAGYQNGGAVYTSKPTSYHKGDLWIVNKGDTGCYIVNGIGDCADSSLVIPSEYESYPINQIADDAFASTDIVSVIISDGVMSIGSRAFSKCYNLSNIIIPDSVESIGECAFEYCEHLTNIIIPNSVTSMGANIFSGCTRLAEIYCEASSKPDGWSSQWNDMEITVHWGVKYAEGLDFQLSDNGDYYIVAGVGSNTDRNLFIPSVYNSLPVMEIGMQAFKGNIKLQNVIIPESIVIINQEAFQDCTNLITVNVPNSVVTIDSYAFSGCSKLLCVNIPSSVNKIGMQAFSHCPKLYNIHIPSSVTEMGSWVFYESTSLMTIYCESESKPSKWDDWWNDGNSASVYWGKIYSMGLSYWFNGDYTMFSAGTLLKALRNSSTFKIGDWEIAQPEIVELLGDINYWMEFDKSEGLEIGQNDGLFYTKITSQNMGFYDNTGTEAVEVVSIGNAAAKIQNANLEGDTTVVNSQHTIFNTDSTFNGDITISENSINSGFQWIIDDGYSLSLVVYGGEE